MATERKVILLEEVTPRILSIRGYNIILDMDLARMYETTTKALNQAVKRNAGRFPAEFMFRLTNEEKQEVVTNCDHLGGPSL
jgi:ORF6N domain